MTYQHLRASMSLPGVSMHLRMSDVCWRTATRASSRSLAWSSGGADVAIVDMVTEPAGYKAEKLPGGPLCGLQSLAEEFGKRQKGIRVQAVVYKALPWDFAQKNCVAAESQDAEQLR